MDAIEGTTSVNKEPCGIYTLPNIFYKRYSDVMARHLAHIFNASLYRGNYLHPPILENTESQADVQEEGHQQPQELQAVIISSQQGSF